MNEIHIRCTNDWISQLEALSGLFPSATYIKYLLNKSLDMDLKTLLDDLKGINLDKDVPRDKRFNIKDYANKDRVSNLAAFCGESVTDYVIKICLIRLKKREESKKEG